MNVLYLFFFVVERLLPEHQKEQAVYTLIKRFLIDLSENDRKSNALLESYINNVLHLLGYSHDLKTYQELTSFIEEIIHEKIPVLDI